MALPRAVVGQPIGAAEYNDMVDVVDSLNLPAFWADSAGTQSIANSASGDGTTLTNYTTATSREWVGTILSAGVATIPVDGWYRVSISCVMASAGSDIRILRAVVGATTVLAEQPSNGAVYLSASTVLRLTSGDLIKMAMRQNSGATLNAVNFQFSVVCERAL